MTQSICQIRRSKIGKIDLICVLFYNTNTSDSIYRRSTAMAIQRSKSFPRILWPSARTNFSQEVIDRLFAELDELASIYMAELAKEGYASVATPALTDHQNFLVCVITVSITGRNGVSA